MLIQMK